MEAVFESAERIRDLMCELIRWEGTAFMANCQGKGNAGGMADCVSFPINVYKNIGLVDAGFETPSYVSIRSKADELAKIYNGFEQIEGAQLVWDSKDGKLVDFSLMIGDVVVCSLGRFVYHMLIYGRNNVFWHCYPKSGVCRVEYSSDKIHRTAKRVYRFFKA